MTTIYYSMTDYTRTLTQVATNEPTEINFVGTFNFKALFQGSTWYQEATGFNFKDNVQSDPNLTNTEKTAFYRNMNLGKETFEAFGNTMIMWLLNFIPQILLSLLLAAWFTDTRAKVRGQGFYKFMLYLPNIITAASISMLFLSIFGYPQGPINIALHKSFAANAQAELATLVPGTEEYQQLLMQINNETSGTVIFFDKTWWARGIISFINFWMWYGNTMIVLIAGILGISPSLYEAAQIDGANASQTFRRITLPLLRPILLYTLVTSLIGGMQMYDIPKIIAGSASSLLLARPKIVTVVVLISDLLGASKNYAIASAISVMLFVFTAMFSLILFYIMRDKDAAKLKKEEKAYKKALGKGM